MLTKNDYQTALDVQDAVNLSGVVFSFAKIMERICEEARAPDVVPSGKTTTPSSGCSPRRSRTSAGWVVELTSMRGTTLMSFASSQPPANTPT